MKKLILILLGLVILFTAIIIASSAIRDELHWRWASYKDQAESYEGYLDSRPNGRHTTEAKKLYDERSWSYAKIPSTIQSFEVYLGKHPEGKYISQANNSIDTLRWMQAKEENTAISYQRYIDAQPNGNFINEATSNKTSLLKDKTPYLAVQKEGTRQSYENFIAQFPGHQLESKARSALQDMEGRDIVDLINQKKVQAKTRGSGIESVEIEIKRLVNHEVKVKIPVGTFFVCRGSAQNMVSTSEKTFSLKDDELHTIEISAACANRTRDIPYDDDSFYIQHSPKQRELQKLMPVLNNANVSSAVEQAAVWIVTDNADYDDLGTLVSRTQFQTFGGTRVINEYETAKAMKICDEAGIDITKKAIWWDRNKIIDGLTDEQLKKWLQEKAKR